LDFRERAGIFFILNTSVPIECRNLTKPPPLEDGTQGKLGMWIDLVPKMDLKERPIVEIKHPPRYEMELRVIIWETANCKFKDEAE